MYIYNYDVVLVIRLFFLCFFSKVLLTYLIWKTSKKTWFSVLLSFKLIVGGFKHCSFPIIFETMIRHVLFVFPCISFSGAWKSLEPGPTNRSYLDIFGLSLSITLLGVSQLITPPFTKQVRFGVTGPAHREVPRPLWRSLSRRGGARGS